MNVTANPNLKFLPSTGSTNTVLKNQFNDNLDHKKVQDVSRTMNSLILLEKSIITSTEYFKTILNLSLNKL